MNAQVTTAGYLLILAAGVAVEIAARLTRRLPTVGEAVEAFNRLRFGRPLLLAAWLWAGWHFFVRASWG